MTENKHSSLNCDDNDSIGEDDINELDEDLFLDDVDSKGSKKTFPNKRIWRKKNLPLKLKKQLQSEMDEFDIEPSGFNSFSKNDEEDEIGDVTRSDGRKKVDEIDEEEFADGIYDEIDDSHYMVSSRGSRGIYRSRGRGLRRGRGRSSFRASYKSTYDRRSGRPYLGHKELPSSKKDDYVTQNRRYLRWKEQQGGPKKEISSMHRRNSSPDYDRRKRDSPPRKRESPSRKRESPVKYRDRSDNSKHDKSRKLDKEISTVEKKKSVVTDSQVRTLFNKMGVSLGLSNKDMLNFDSLSAEESISLLQNVFTNENDKKLTATDVDKKMKLIEKKELTGGSGVLLPPQLQKQMLLGKLESAIQKNTLQDKSAKSDSDKKEAIDMFSDDVPSKNKSDMPDSSKSVNLMSSNKDKHSLSPSRSKTESNDNDVNKRKDRQRKSRSPDYRARSHRSNSRSRERSRSRSSGRHRSRSHSPGRNRSPIGRSRRGFHDRYNSPYSHRPRSSSRSPVRRHMESPPYHSTRRDYSPRRRDYSPVGRHYSPEGRRNYSPHRRRTPPSDRRSPQSLAAWEREVRLKSPRRDRKESSDRSACSSPPRDARWERDTPPNPLASVPGSKRPLTPPSGQPSSFVTKSPGRSNWNQTANEDMSNPPPPGADFQSGPPVYRMPHHASSSIHEGYNMGIPPPTHRGPPPFDVIHGGPSSRMPLPRPEFRGQMPPPHIGPPRMGPPPIHGPHDIYPLRPMVPPHSFHPGPSVSGPPPENYFGHHQPAPGFAGPPDGRPPNWNQPEMHHYHEPPPPPPPQISAPQAPPPPPPPPRVSNDNSVIVLSPEHNSSNNETPKVNDPKKDAVQMELQNQKLTLSKQRSEYIKKADVLERDLNLLKQQKKDLLEENSPDNDRILKENAKLQGELQNKLKAITNVIDMLTGIIGDDKNLIIDDEKVSKNENSKSQGASSLSTSTPSSSLDATSVKSSGRTKLSPQRVSKDRTSTPQASIVHERDHDFNRRNDSKSPSTKRHSTNVELKMHQDKRRRTRSRTPSPLPMPPGCDNFDKDVKSGTVISESAENLHPKKITTIPLAAVSTASPISAGAHAIPQMYNYVHYDPEIHWCRICNVFPRTAKDYLNHLHMPEHKKEIKEQKIQDMPWHTAHPHEELPQVPNAQTKRVPIRGLQFFISATAWYCKLCDVWIGDLHCASLHLKSAVHSKNYNEYSEQNPNWEVDWMSTRTRAYERTTEEKRRMKETPSVQPSSVRDKPRSGRSIRNTDARASSSGHGLSQPSSKDDSKRKSKDSSNDNNSSKGDLLSKSISKQIIAALNANKKSKKSKKSSSKKGKSSSSSSSSSSSNSSTSSSSSDDSDEKDPKKSIRVAMRKKKSNKSTNGDKSGKDENAMYIEVPNIRSKWDSPEKEIVDQSSTDKTKSDKIESPLAVPQSLSTEQKEDDKLLKEWMALGDNEKDKNIILNLKDRLKQKYEAGREMERIKAEERRKEIRERRHAESDDRGSSKRHSDKSKDKKDTSERKSNSSSSSNTTHDKVVNKNEEREDKKDEDRKVEKPSGGKQNSIPGGDESEDDAEANFEKRALESANKKKESKKLPVINIGKAKLPFIGRMPFMGRGLAKKKSESDSGETVTTDAKADSKTAPCDSTSPDTASNKNLVWPDIPKIVDQSNASKESTKETQAVGASLAALKPDQEKSDKLKPLVINLPKSTLSLTKTPGLPKQLIRMKIPKMRFPDDAVGVEDMDIDNDEEDNIRKENEDNLPTDFKEALNILFPSENPEDKSGENQSSEPGLMVLHQQPEMSAHLEHSVTISHESPIIMQAPPPPIISSHDHHSILGGPPGPAPPPPIIGSTIDQHYSAHGIMPPQQMISPVQPHPTHLGPPGTQMISCPPPIGPPQVCPGPPQMSSGDVAHAPPPPMIRMHGPPPPPPPVPIIGPLMPLPQPQSEILSEDADGENQIVYPKRKNPPSQKKRQQLRKIKERLQKEEKELQEKIEEAKRKQLEDEVKKKEIEKNKARAELAMLGIDEDDMAAQMF